MGLFMHWGNYGVVCVLSNWGYLCIRVTVGVFM